MDLNPWISIGFFSCAISSIAANLEFSRLAAILEIAQENNPIGIPMGA